MTDNCRYTISEYPQGSQEWLNIRAGKVTGSRAIDMLARKADGTWKASRTDYMCELGTERFTGVPNPQDYISAEMRWGIEQEPFARMAYEAITGNFVEENGFFLLKNMLAGCSLDGLFEENGKTGIIEIKCMKTLKHIKQIEKGGVSEEHIDQVIHNTWVAGADFCDYVLYDPRLPKELQTYIYRYTPTPQELKKHEEEVVIFLAEVEEYMARVLKNAKSRKRVA